MRAVVCKAFGPPEDLVVDLVDDPAVGPDQLLIDVAAAAVVYPDTLMLQDKYQYKASPPYIPGGEVAGVVIGVGERVAGWSIGDRVLGALGATGGYAELCAIPAASARRLPDSVDFAAAAGLNYAYGTTLYGLQHRAGLREGETLLVLGAGGSVGLSAVEIGKLLGARVIPVEVRRQPRATFRRLSSESSEASYPGLATSPSATKSWPDSWNSTTAEPKQSKWRGSWRRGAKGQKTTTGQKTKSQGEELF